MICKLLARIFGNNNSVEIDDGTKIFEQRAHSLQQERTVAAKQIAKAIVRAYKSRAKDTRHLSIQVNLREYHSAMAQKYLHDSAVEEAIKTILNENGWEIAFSEYHASCQVEPLTARTNVLR